MDRFRSIGKLLGARTANSSEGRGTTQRLSRRAVAILALMGILAVGAPQVAGAATGGAAGPEAGAAGAAIALAPGQATDGGFTCDYGQGRRVLATPPQMTAIGTGFKNVGWQPVLYKWNGSAWVVRSNNVLWSGTLYGQYMVAAATRSGVVPPWTNMYNGRTTLEFGFTGLESGYYTVLNYYKWYENGATASTWSWNRNGGTYCLLS